LDWVKKPAFNKLYGALRRRKFLPVRFPWMTAGNAGIKAVVRRRKQPVNLAASQAGSPYCPLPIRRHDLALQQKRSVNYSDYKVEELDKM
jgi:hypothetical protein